MSPSSAAEQVLAAILSCAEDAIVGIGLDGSVQLWSRGAEQLYGYTAAEVRGHSLTHLVPLYEVPVFGEMLETARRGTLRERENVERLHKGGARLSVTVKRAPLRNERGELIGVLETGRRVCSTAKEMAADTQLRLLV